MMAEFIEGKEQVVNKSDPVIFENKTGSSFDVSVGVVFHKSGIYEVTIAENRTVVSKIMERPKQGEWLEREVMYEPNGKYITQWQSAKCSICKHYHTTPYLYRFDEYDFCPHCGSKMGRKQDG